MDRPKLAKRCCKCGKAFTTINNTRCYCAKCSYPRQVRYKKAHPDKVKVREAKWRSTHRKRTRAYVHAWRDEVKRKVFALYGSKCAICGFSDPRALQIDHINGMQGKSRSFRRSGAQLYSAILQGKVPKEECQCLCANCNWIKRFERVEHLQRLGD